MPVKTTSTYSDLLAEVHQSHEIRQPLYEQIEKQLEAHFQVKARVLAFFTSFNFPVIIEDADADMIEEVLRNTDMDHRELFLILNSPGGEALAAERIVNICRTFGGGQFSVVVPKMAKSAATMICFGAKRILMNATSELGPVDPQVAIRNDQGRVFQYQAAHEIVEAYHDLMDKANKTRGRVEPYLQQLQRFDARDIRAIASAQKLSENISVKALITGCMKGSKETAIRSKIKPFLDPQYTISHGRPMYPDSISKTGLNIEVMDRKCDLWQTIWSLYVRLNHVVNTNLSATKVIESLLTEYGAPFPAGALR